MDFNNSKNIDVARTIIDEKERTSQTPISNRTTSEMKVKVEDDKHKTNSEKVFISYTHSDKDIVHRVATKIEEDNPIWIDKDKIDVGYSLTKEIEEGIQQSSFVVCFISKKYAASANCRLEFFYAHTIKKKCLYVLLEKMKIEEVTDMAIYIYGESIRLDGFELFKQNQDEYANEIYSKLVNVFKTGVNQSTAVLKEENIFSIRDDCFTGREDVFTSIDNSKRIVVLHGLPGVGKTSVSKEYAYRRRDENVFDKVYWINADAEYKINEALYNYGTKLRGFKKRVLLIFDNVEDLNHVTNVVNINEVKCKVLITTKSEKIKPNYVTRIDVKPFGLNEMKEYMEQKLSSFDQEQLNKVIDKLQVNKECLPYKLSMISTILVDDPSVDIDELLRSNYNKSNTFLMRIVNKLTKKKETQAVELLEYLVSLDPDNIPGKLIETILSGNGHMKAMQALIDQNLCRIVSPNTSHYGLKVHRLLQEDLEDYFKSTEDESRSKERVSNLMNMLEELFPDANQNPDETWITGSIYYPHAIKIMSKIESQKQTPSAVIFEKIADYNGCVLVNYHAAVDYAQKAIDCLNKDDVNENFAELNSKVGCFYSALGNTEKAIEYLTIGLEMRKGLFKGDDHLSIAASYHNIGLEYFTLGNIEKTIEYQTMALEMQKRLFKGDDNPHIAASYNNIGRRYSALGNTEKAIEYYTIALEMQKRLFKGDDHPHVALSYNNIGMEYSNLGNTEKAIEYYTIAFEMQKRLFKGDDHPDVAVSYNNIGMQYSKSGNKEKAIEYLTIALEMEKRLFKGDDHPSIARSYNNIGGQYSELGNTEKAIEYYTIALEMHQRLFMGDDHPSIATSYHNIGMEYSKSGNKEKAIEYLTIALEMEKRLFKGDDHPSIATSYNEIGMQYSRSGNKEKAIEYLTIALEMRQRLFMGDDHPSIATSYNNIGGQYSELGNKEKAIEYLTIAFEMQKRLFKGDDHPHVALSYNNIGMEYSNLGNTEKAIEYYTIALEMQKRLFKGDDHPHVALSYNNIGMQYYRLGNKEKAIEYLKIGVEMRQRLFKGDDHPDLATSYNNIGGQYSELGNTEKAIEYYTIALEMRQRFFKGDDHPDVATSYNNIGMEYYALGKTQKAIEYFTIALGILRKFYRNDHPSVKTISNNISSLTTFTTFIIETSK